MVSNRATSMVRLKPLLFSLVFWVTLCLILTQSPLAWSLIKGKFKDEPSYLLQTSLFDASFNSNDIKLIIGSKIFIAKQRSANGHDGIFINIFKPNLCRIGMAIQSASMAKKLTSIIIQGSPQFWSDMDLGVKENGPNQNMEYWNILYGEDFEFRGSLQLFFRWAKDMVTHKPKNSIGTEKMQLLNFLHFREINKQTKCLDKKLRAVNINPSIITIVPHYDEVDLNTNPELVNKFKQCIDTSNCLQKYKFIDSDANYQHR